MNKFLCWIVGQDHRTFDSNFEKDKIDYRNFAHVIMIPVLIELAASFLISHRIFNLSYPISALVSVFWAYLILMIERAVINAPQQKVNGKLSLTSKMLYGIRIAMGILIALFGTFTFDTILFDKEISQQLRETEITKINNEYNLLISKQSKQTEQFNLDWKNKLHDMNCEASGRCTGEYSQISGVGPRFKEIKSQADKLQVLYQTSEDKVKSLSIERDNKVNDAKLNIVNQSGLLERVKALHTFIKKDIAAQALFWIVLVLLFFFQLLVVLFKLVSGESVKNRIINNKTKIMIDKHDLYTDIATSKAADAYELITSRGVTII
jgi:hypothetical protein